MFAGEEKPSQIDPGKVSIKPGHNSEAGSHHQHDTNCMFSDCPQQLSCSRVKRDCLHLMKSSNSPRQTFSALFLSASEVSENSLIPTPHLTNCPNISTTSQTCCPPIALLSAPQGLELIISKPQRLEAAARLPKRGSAGGSSARRLQQVLLLVLPEQLCSQMQCLLFPEV